MVSVLVATVADAVRTLAALVALVAGAPLAEAAVMPPTVARAARPMLAMMIFARFIVASLRDALSTKTDSNAIRLIARAIRLRVRRVGGQGVRLPPRVRGPRLR